MKTYKVTLTIIVNGNYEKSTVHTLKAINEKHAERLALKNESHNDDAGYQEDGFYWDDDMVYKVASVELCKPTLSFKVGDKYSAEDIKKEIEYLLPFVESDLFNTLTDIEVIS